jgi:hypothetical protein
MLWSCLLAIKSLFEIFLSQPLASFCGFSIIHLSQIGHGLSTMFKLSFVEEIGWDVAHVRETENLLYYFDRFIARFEEAGAAIDQTQNVPCREAFGTGCSRVLRRIKGWYEAKVATESEQENGQEQTSLMGMEDVSIGGSFDYLDDAYWQDILDDLNLMQS